MWRSLMRFVARPDPIIVCAGVGQGGCMRGLLNIGPRVEIFGFEPSPASFRAAAAKFAGNPRVHLFQRALADRGGRRPFYLNHNQATSSLFPMDTAHPAYQAGFRNESIVEVKCTTLDDFTAERGLDRIDLLFSDAQGAEKLILDGAHRLLAAGQIKVLLLELLFYDLYTGAPLFYETMEKLKGYRYVLHSLYNFRVGGEGDLRWADFLFFRGKH